MSQIKDKVNYSLIDYSNTKFANNEFDGIYAFETICHSPDIKNTFREFKRILKKKGKLVFFEYTLLNQNKYTKKEQQILELIKDMTAMWSFLEFIPESIVKTLGENGFRNINAIDLTENWKPSLEHYYKIGVIPYFFIKLFKLKRKFPNVTSIVEAHNLAKKGLLKYHAFTATK